MPAIAPLAIQGVSTIMGMNQASQMRADAKEAANIARADKKKQDDLMEQQKQEYRDIEFKNPYADMENVYEDVTVNQQQAQFQAQQGAQQRANIMQGLRGAAGGSGIAGLAQSLANQGQLQTQQASASIGLQAAGASAAYQQQLQNQQAANTAASSMQADAITGLAGAAMKTKWTGEGSVGEWFDK